MFLKKLKYKTIHLSNADIWEVEEIEFYKFNLIVGQNAVGKSRLLGLISIFSRMVNREEDLMPGAWELVFESFDKDLIEFSFYIDLTKKIINEKLLINKKIFLNRDEERAIIHNLKISSDEEFNPPQNLLVIHSRRDKINYPYLEEIADWAKNVFGFKFNNINPRFYNSYNSDGLTSFDTLFALIRPVEEKGLLDNYRRDCIKDLNEIGYNISDITYEKSDIDPRRDILKIHEEGLQFPFSHSMLSQGMFRSLAVIFFLNYLILEHTKSTIVIDDLGEGLDYDRTTKLGKLIFRKIENHDNIQFIASSNDNFLMDVIDIKHWNILHREGNVVKSYNYVNNRDRFEEFKFTGLSNFDLFSSDYLLDIK